MDTGPVVVGVGDFSGQEGVVLYAAREAVMRSAPLRIAHAVTLPSSYGRSHAKETRRGVVNRRAVLVERLVETVRSAFPSLVVASGLTFDDPVRLLAKQSAEAVLVVLGRGDRGFPRLPLGSVSLRVVGQAQCPVLVWRPGGAGGVQDDRVVVGIDRVHHSPEVLEFAFAEADRRSAHLLIAHALHRPTPSPLPHTGTAARRRTREAEEAARSFLDERIGEVGGRYPGVTVGLRLGWGRPARCLVESSEDAALLVMGSRRRSGRRRLLLGSVSAEVLHMADGPVAVVPTR
ncbi:universal stress protein [Streptomyces sp. T028]|uniref:universal stress protein n=1 Tax=Streptomyces sp. T028 TaxID=3394379 RepID=UPI003A849915